jgi:hypothetical protein
MMVWRLRLPMTKKLILVGLFSLTIITMGTALVRLLVVPHGEIGADLTWTFTWTTIEMCICEHASKLILGHHLILD